LNPTIVKDRFNRRIRFLRARWHADGDALLANGQYLEFTDGLLRLMRQLDAISAAIERQTSSPDFRFLGRSSSAADIAALEKGSKKPRRGPKNNLT
jgi:hypothetical protein